MAINGDDGDFGLDCWIDPESTGEPDQEFFSDDLGELKAEAERLIASGQFKYILLSRWSPDEDEWETLEEFGDA